jgi:hypothetical protein
VRTLELSLRTPYLAVTPNILGPNPLWWHKGMKLPDYIEQLAHGLLKAGFEEAHAIATAVYNVEHWKDGIPTGNMPRVRPETKAASAAAWAEWMKLRAETHSEHALEFAAKKAAAASTKTAAAKPATTAKVTSSAVKATASSGKTTAAAKATPPATNKTSSSSGVAAQVAALRQQASNDTYEANLLEAEANSIVKDYLTSANASKVGGIQGNTTYPASSTTSSGATTGSTSSGTSTATGTSTSTTGSSTSSSSTPSTSSGTTASGTASTASTAGSSGSTAAGTTGSGSASTGTSGSSSSGSSTSSSAAGKTQAQYIAEVQSLRQEAAALRQKAAQLNAQADALAKSADATATASLGQAAANAAEALKRLVQFAQTVGRDTSDPRYHDGEQPTRTPPPPIAGGRKRMASPTAADRRTALQHGNALPPLHGGGSGEARFPITDESSLKKAIRMVGLAKGDKNAIRRYIIRKANSMGLSHLIPPHWRGGTSEAAMDAIDLKVAAEFALSLAERPSVSSGTDGPVVAYKNGTRVHHHKRGKSSGSGSDSGGTASKVGARGAQAGAGEGDDGDGGEDDDTDPFDIHDDDSLRRAVRASGKAKNKKAVRGYIKRRASAIGREHMVPSHWNDDGSSDVED